MCATGGLNILSLAYLDDVDVDVVVGTRQGMQVQCKLKLVPLAGEWGPRAGGRGIGTWLLVAAAMPRQSLQVYGPDLLLSLARTPRSSHPWVLRLWSMKSPSDTCRLWVLKSFSSGPSLPLHHTVVLRASIPSLMLFLTPLTSIVRSCLASYFLFSFSIDCVRLIFF